MSKQNLCSYTFSLKLKELGFNKKCSAYYNDLGDLIYESRKNSSTNKPDMYNYCTAPSWQQATNFLNKKYKF